MKKVKKKLNKNIQILIIILIIFAIIATVSFAIYKSVIEGKVESDIATTVIDLTTTENTTPSINPDNTSLEYTFSVKNFKTENGTTKINEVLSDYYIKVSGITTPELTTTLYYDLGNGTKEALTLETWGEFEGYYKSNLNLGIDKEYTHNYILKIETNTTISNNYSLPIVIDLGYIQTLQPESYVNPPELTDGMIPVVYDETTFAWKKTSTSNTSWYNYDEKRWANVVIAKNNYNGTNSYSTAPDETQIPYTDIISMFVWIPRYVYRIPEEFYHASVDVSDFETLTNYHNAMDIHFSKTKDQGGDNWDKDILVVNAKDESINSHEAWTTNEAFNFDGQYLNGLWIAKFKVSDETADTTNNNATGSIDNIYIGPARYMEVGFTLDNAFSACRNMETNSLYGWKTASGLKSDGLFTTDGNGIDIHLTKNSEWATVAYLGQSKYGQNKVGINQYIKRYTNIISGGINTTAPGSYETVFTENTNSSTTGNPYGVYDMSSLVWDWVSAYIGDGSNVKSPKVYNANLKYKDVYKPKEGVIVDYSDKNSVYSIFKDIKGAAIWETSSNGNASTSTWFGGRSNIGSITNGTANLLMTRGGSYSYNNIALGTDARASVFSFGYAYGGDLSDKNISRGFRPVIAVNSNF